MSKSVIKEIFIMLLLCVAIVLVLGILFYDYIPNNRIVPAKATYATPENVQSEIDEQLANSEKKENSYEITDSDLELYKQTSEYKAGKKDPFSLEEENQNTTAENTNTTEQSNTQEENQGEATNQSTTSQTDLTNTNLPNVNTNVNSKVNTSVRRSTTSSNTNNNTNNTANANNNTNNNANNNTNTGTKSTNNGNVSTKTTSNVKTNQNSTGTFFEDNGLK